MGTFAVRLSGCGRSYLRNGEQVPVFRDVGFEVGDGEVVALLGPSGCGKSTLLRSVAGLEQLETGTITYGDAGNRRQPAGLVFQEALLLPWLTVRENVALGLRYRANRGTGTAADVERILVEFGISAYADAYPDQVSGGQAQRANLARAVVTQPSILLLDEPFSALDPATRSAMQGWLRDVMHMEQLSALLVTHDVDEALAVSDRILLMSPRPGRIVGEWPRPTMPEQVAAARQAIIGQYRTDVALGATSSYVI